MKNCLPHCEDISPTDSHIHPLKGIRAFFITLFCFSSSVLFAQLKVTGKVTAVDSAVVGATIQVKGSGASTQTDAEGNFVINAPGNGTLIISFVGYARQEINITDRRVINVQLQATGQQLTDVVVVGYGTQSRATVTASITKVDGRNISNQPVSTPAEALAGLAAGVQIQSDQGAKPGAAPTVRVRGVSSLSASNDPLYVVDGYPLQSPSNFTLINPNDIESIEVLKDAASAAIYGSRAANGVVLVTTKRGKSGRTVFSVSAYTGLQNVNRFNDVLNKQDFVTYVKDISRLTNRAYPAVLDGDISALAETNWQKEVFRTAPMQDFEINASGGTEKVRFSASAGAFKQKGVVIGTEYTRYSTRVNLDADLVKNLKFGFSISPSFSEQYRQPTSGQASGAGANPADLITGVPGLVADLNLPSPLNQALTFMPIVPVYLPNGNFAQPYYREVGLNLSPTAVFSAGNFYNPVGILTQTINRSRAFRTLGNAFLEFAPIPGLRLKTYFGATIENEQVHAYIPATMGYGSAPNASYTNPDLNAIYASDNARNSFDWVWEHTATSDKKFGEHHINLLGLFSSQKFTSEIVYVAGLPRTFITTSVQNPRASTNTAGTEAYDANAFVSYAGRFTYDYSKKYLATIAIRQDASSRFGPNNRYAVFPSFSVGWRLTEEPAISALLERISINEFKLRGGYGRTGNANIGSFTYVNSISLNRNYSFGNSRNFGTQQTGFANPDLTWEKNDQVSIGADIGIMNNLIILTADYFIRYSKGMLLNKDLPLIIGYANTYQSNLGTLQNKGVEFTATSTLNLGPVRWVINANLSTYKTKVTDLGGPLALPGVAAINGWNNVYQVKVGNPLGLMYGYKVDGVFKNTADLAKYPQTVAGNNVGDYKVVDANGDGKIDINDVTVLGHGLPDFIYGLTNTFQYKSFDLNILIQGVQGVSIINGNDRQTLSTNNNQNTLYKYFNNYFDPAKPDRDVTYSRPGQSSSIPGPSIINLNVQNGSYLRVRNITFGYRLTDAIVKKILLKSARVYITAQNPFLITKYSGSNPEANVSGSNPITAGVDQGSYPAARTIIAGINIGF